LTNTFRQECLKGNKAPADQATLCIPNYGVGQGPKWQPTSFRHQQLPNKLKQWLFDSGSLTKKLIDYSNNQLRVEVIDQRIKRARFSEYKALKLKHHQYAVVREVILYGAETPLVYARTIMPLSTLKGSLRRLYYLGNQPLGGALFADPTMRRGELEIARVKSNLLPTKTLSLSKSAHDKQSIVQAPPQQCWGRRSLFFLQNRPLLVCEIFLPNLYH